MSEYNNATEFVYDGNSNHIAEKLNGITKKKYVNDVSGDLTHILIERDVQTSTDLYGAGLISQGGVSEQNRQYYLEDGLGNIRVVTDSNGNKVKASMIPMAMYSH